MSRFICNIWRRAFDGSVGVGKGSGGGESGRI